MNNQEEILIIDEKRKNRAFLSQILNSLDVSIKEASSLSETSNQLSNSTNISMAMICLSPSYGNALNFLRRIKSINPELSIVLLSEIEEQDMAISLLQKGIIDHIAPPHNAAGIFSAVKNGLDKRELIKKNKLYLQKLGNLRLQQQKNIRKALELEDIYDTTIENLMTALDMRDVETFGHSQAVAKYSQILSQILGIKDKDILDNIRKGSLLHDVGKIAIPDSILKKPGSLSAKEWEKIRLHPSLGFGLIKEIKLLKEVGNIILYHHERYDGTGYPKQLKKDKIPIEARIFALADALDAITSHRPYSKERDFKTAKKEIQENANTQFDPQVVEAFCSLSSDKWKKIRFETTRIIPSFEDMLHTMQ